ncbi:MAG: hypothetical protein MUF34_21650 [Polyangiaceae bacterium]|jgi:hypothetical protein|nr:hypothetical protein [Polyangiaceae bacterium]
MSRRVPAPLLLIVSSRRVPAPLLLAAALLAPLPLAWHAQAARAARRHDAPAIAAAVSALPWPDLALGGGARHLRFLSLEEPGAAFADGPAAADADPAGGALAPPAAVWAEIAAPKP